MKRFSVVVGAAVLTASLVATAFGRNATSVATPARILMMDSLPSPAGTGSAEPNLTVGPDGRVYMTWLEPTNPGHALKFSVHDGTEWSAAQTIVQRADFFVNWADFPSLVVLDGGRLAAHWLQRNGAGTYAYGVRISQSSDAGKTWSTPVVPHRDSSETEHGFVALWNERGTVGAVWLDGRKFKAAGHDAANEMMLVSTTLAANGTRGAEMRLDERTCDCCQNAAAMTSSGPIIAYRNRSDDEIRDIYVTRRVGNSWTAGVPAHNDRWKIAACPVNGPALSARGNRVALAWFTAPSDSGRVNLAFSDNAGAKFGAPVRIDAGTPAGRVDVTLMPDGGALVTWVERTGRDVASVQARRVSRDGRAGVPMTIATSSAARASGFPHAVITGNTVMFAWTVAGRPSSVRVSRVPLTEFR
ncbi:MAG: exo-alpha-sialidase [Phycisphaerae bacterium]|nr:exo-alpha-sialidase [Gemmatimonadaceae bacterium]